MEDDGKAKSLIDIENKQHLSQMNAKAERLSRVATKIESLLLEEDMTWGEWGEVVELFSTRIGQMVAQIKVTKY